jgi:hypothetical protein
MRAVAPLVLVVNVLLASAAQATVGVFPIATTGFSGNEGKVRADEVMTTMKRVLKDRFDPITNVKPGCEKDKACVAEQLKGDVEELALVSLAKNGDIVSVTLRIVDGAGEEVTLPTSNIPIDQSIGDAIAALVTQGFDPSHYAGTVEVKNVPEGASVFIDGLPFEGPTARLAVRQHDLLVVKQGRTLRHDVFAVSFAKSTVVDASAPEVPAPAAEPPSPLPMYLATTGVIAGLVVAVGTAVGSPLILSDDDRDNRVKLLDAFPTVGDDPTSAEYGQQGSYGSDSHQALLVGDVVGTAREVHTLRSFDAQRAVTPYIIVAGTTVAVASGVALAATLFLGGE